MELSILTPEHTAYIGHFAGWTSGGVDWLDVPERPGPSTAWPIISFRNAVVAATVVFSSWDVCITPRLVSLTGWHLCPSPPHSTRRIVYMSEQCILPVALKKQVWLSWLQLNRSNMTLQIHCMPKLLSYELNLIKECVLDAQACIWLQSIHIFAAKTIQIQSEILFLRLESHHLCITEHWCNAVEFFKGYWLTRL